MNRKAHSTATRLSYTSPDGRIRVEYEPGDAKPFALICDGEFQSYYPTSSAAEVAGLVYLQGKVATMEAELAAEPRLYIRDGMVSRRRVNWGSEAA
jgi:hypothetical protein